MNQIHDSQVVYRRKTLQLKEYMNLPIKSNSYKLLKKTMRASVGKLYIFQHKPTITDFAKNSVIINGYDQSETWYLNCCFFTRQLHRQMSEPKTGNRVYLRKAVNLMLGYKLFLFDKAEGSRLIAVVPERRKKPQRITEESVIKWGATLLGDHANRRDIFFERVTINDIREKILWMNPSANCH